MSSYKGHTVGALLMFLPVAVWCIAMHWSLGLVAGGLGAMLLGALFPDVDTASKGRRLLLMVLVGVAFLLYVWHFYAAASLVGAAGMTLVIGARHRGLFHNFYFLSMLAGGAVVAGRYWFPQYSFLLVTGGGFFIYGCWSHLVLDYGIRRSFWWR